jgi:hypothetical protein
MFKHGYLMGHPKVGKNTRSIPISIQVSYERHSRVKNLACTHTHWVPDTHTRIAIPNNIIRIRQIK